MSWVPGNLTQLCTNGSTASICQPNSLLFLQLVFSLFTTKSNVTPTNSIPKPVEYDFIIVGGGTAGCILANRLTEIREWNVLLLEAGIEEPNITNVPAFMPLLRKSNIDWNYKSQPEKNACLANNGCNFPSGKVMGGTSSINGMLYVRGNREDYNNWSNLGNTGWSYRNVLRYFKKSERNRDEEIVYDNYGYHGTNGYQSVQRFPYVDKNLNIIQKALRRLGYESIDVNGESQLGSMILQTTSFNGQRQSTNNAFIRPIRRNRPNLFIETEAYVTKIIIDSKTKKATGVEYTVTSNNNTKLIAKAKKEVILSAGAIKSPQLLMLSGIGPADELQKHNIRLIRNTTVGSNLQDHLQFVGVYAILDSNHTTDTSFDQKKMDLTLYLRTHSGPLSATGISTVVAFAQTEHEYSDEAPDVQLCFTGMKYSDNSLSSVLSYYDAVNFYPILLAPKSKGFIRLNETDPVWGSPLIYPGYLSNDIDVSRMIEGIRKGLRLFKGSTFTKNNYKLYDVPQAPCNNFEFNSDEYWVCMLRSHTGVGAHAVGTCKMGPYDDPRAIVDPRLRVYGIRRLRVVDASIMPVIPRGNIMAPTMMIAEKAGDMIKEDWLGD
ncbi:glucose dehydrogenase [FAD, quinone] isoform X1 [Leptopilina boulardi]|uniref:glucose dehydrogenase [FAD, quinone] isoform X1 n=1 Tax=Leptopilina boulardi TaxID=63433 RepID=UPI0021F5AB1D|nr:glucose dehydrogenase [FAD, quinone] isoform X1 [Leptopilina boulardi]XP_051160396.1 glucose dehydrogenase [FAD, quinone] isoform X1 [Leptopilina boulardi]